MKLFIVIALVIVIYAKLTLSDNNPKFGAHMWGCKSNACNISDGHFCTDRWCIDYICGIQKPGVEWVMLVPFESMRPTCTHKYYGNEPTANMSLVELSWNRPISDVKYCHSIDHCLDLVCNDYVKNNNITGFGIVPNMTQCIKYYGPNN
jgi:hypothetical protein